MVLTVPPLRSVARYSRVSASSSGSSTSKVGKIVILLRTERYTAAPVTARPSTARATDQLRNGVAG